MVAGVTLRATFALISLLGCHRVAYGQAPTLQQRPAAVDNVVDNVVEDTWPATCPTTWLFQQRLAPSSVASAATCSEIHLHLGARDGTLWIELSCVRESETTTRRLEHTSCETLIENAALAIELWQDHEPHIAAAEETPVIEESPTLPPSALPAPAPDVGYAPSFEMGLRAALGAAPTPTLGAELSCDFPLSDISFSLGVVYDATPGVVRANSLPLFLHSLRLAAGLRVSWQHFAALLFARGGAQWIHRDDDGAVATAFVAELGARVIVVFPVGEQLSLELGGEIAVQALRTRIVHGATLVFETSPVVGALVVLARL